MPSKRSSDWFEAYLRLEPWLLSQIDADPSHIDLAILDACVIETRELQSGIRFKSIASWNASNDAIVIGKLRQYPSSFGLAVIYSYSKDGFIREAAVKNLALIGERSLPYLIVRSCDWVWQIARLAEREAAKLIPTTSNQTLIDCLGSLAAIDRAGKMASTTSNLLIQEVLQRPGLLHSARKNLPNRLRLLLIENRFVGAGEDWNEILRDGLKCPQGNIVQRSLRGIRELSTDQRLEMLEFLRRSKSVFARLEAIQIAHESGMTTVLSSFLDDKNWRVRGAARLNLAKHGISGFLDHYREGFPSPISIAGFCELASDKELDELAPFLEYSLASVRYETVRALSRREDIKDAPLFVARLADDKTPVVRAAVAALMKIGYRIEVDELKALLLGTSDLKLRRAMEGALVLVTRWDSVKLALDLCARGELVRDVNVVLERWLAKKGWDYSGPSLEKLAAAKASFDRCRTKISETVASSFDYELDYWVTKLHVS